jgi:hypothetical protein
MYAATGDAIGTVRPALALLARPTDRPGDSGNTRLFAAGDRPDRSALEDIAPPPRGTDRLLRVAPAPPNDADGD